MAYSEQKNGNTFDCLVHTCLPSSDFDQSKPNSANKYNFAVFEAIHQVSEEGEIEQCLVLGRRPHAKIRVQSTESSTAGC